MSPTRDESGRAAKIPQIPSEAIMNEHAKQEFPAYSGAMNARPLICLVAALLGGIRTSAHADSPAAAPIDRQALVMRHSPTITSVDRAAPFMIGNGNLAFT